MENITNTLEGITINPMPVKQTNSTSSHSSPLNYKPIKSSTTCSKELEIFLDHLKEKECKSPCYHHGLICCMSIIGFMIRHGKKTDGGDKQEPGEINFQKGLDFCLKGETKEGFKYMQLAAEEGYEMAEANVAVCYIQGIGVEHNLSKAISIFESLVKEKRNLIAQHNLGVCYLLGKGVKQDFGSAAFLFKRAAKQGHAWSSNNLGFCYLHGLGRKKNLEKAIQFFVEAGENGMPESFLYLYQLYSHKEDSAFVKQLPVEDIKKAQDYLILAAKRGSIEAQSFLSQTLLMNKEYEKSFYWTSLAAKRDHAVSQFNLASFYVNGWYVKEDQEKAVEWYRKSVENGFVLGFSALGQHYYEGKGVKKDFNMAVPLLTVAATFDVVHAQYLLGCIYSTGNQTDSNNNNNDEKEKQIAKDLTKAVSFLEKAAGQNHDKAILKLIDLYEREEALKNVEKAKEYRRRLAKIYTSQGIY